MTELSGHAVQVSAATLSDLPRIPANSLPMFTGHARKVIEDLAQNRLRAFTATIDPATGEYLDDPYAQNKSLSEHVAADYQGRFLIELIQNGNDAHPRERTDGTIEVLLAEEGTFGTVYVANRGLPFSEKQARALSRIGRSSKPPGEAIGNKGLGFRSVSHVCDAPEIYSQSGPAMVGPAFDGFCFTLQHGSALDGYFGDPRIAQLAKRDLPMFSVPRWLTEQPQRVRSFAERGFASVVRLVLRNQEARADALGQFRLLMNQSVPTLLFMERLCRLTALIEGPDTTSLDRVALTRSETQLPASPLKVSMINLGQQGTFLLTKAPVPEQSMKAAIVAGVETKQLHSSWKEWSGDGEVALAVRTDNGPVVPRLYTFLPMSEGAAAPFHGYLHGSFFPTSSRKTIDAAVELNRLLLEEAASLAAATVRWLAGHTATQPLRGPTDAGAVARAAVDLLVWNRVSSLGGERGDETAGKRYGRIDLPTTVARQVSDPGGKFADTAILPCLGATEEATYGIEQIVWRAPRAARYWVDASETFTVACLADHGRSLGIAPFWPGLGEGRAMRLVGFLNTHAQQDFPTHPSPSERAAIAESLARSLPRGREMPVARWNAFYRDLVEFMDSSPLPLVGRQIILCGDGRLRSGRSVETVDEETFMRPRRRRRRGEQVEASVFFPPAPRQTGDAENGTADGLKVPSPLREYFAFASEALPWHGELKRAREFLEGSLVSAYDGETVLTRISQVVNGSKTTEKAVAGLRWAFAIWHRAGRRLLGGSRSYRLLVPTVDGELISASDAVFSESWPDETHGKRLKQFLDTAPAGVTDLVDFGRRRLAPTSHRAFRKARTTEWVEFLNALGVNRGLFAVEKTAGRRFKAHELTDFTFCGEVAIPKSAAESWKNDVERFASRGASLGYTTNYSIKGSLWWLPGQADHESFSNDCRELYAALVVEWLVQAPETVFNVAIEHQYYSSDTREWPTPVASFLRSGKWMPADDPQATGGVRGHFAPSDIWISGSSGERFPYYLRQPAVALSKAIERVGEAGRERLTRHAHLRVLGERTTLLEQARFLADQFASGTVNRHYEPQFINLYSATWKAIADWYAADPNVLVNAIAPEFLVVRRGRELSAAALGTTDTRPICVRDNADEIAPGLISAAGDAMLEVKGADPARVGVLFDAIYGDRIRLFSRLRYDVRADNVPINQMPHDHTVLDVCAWLRPMAAFAIEALTGTAAGQLPADRSSLLARLDNIGLQLVVDVHFELNGIVVSPAAGRRAHFFRRTDGTPLVVVRHAGTVSWDVIEDCLQSICDAIDIPQIATSMRLLARELEIRGAEVGERRIERADLELLGRTLYLDEHALAGAHHLLVDRLDFNLSWIRAVVHHVGDADALHTFDCAEVGADSDPNLLRNVLAPLLAPAGISPDRVIDACRRSFTTENFRERMGFTLAAFNENLIATGNEPETYPQLHADQILHFVTSHEVEIIQSLRNKVAEKLERREEAPEYVQLRTEIRSITPDPAWLLLYKTVPPDVVARHVEAWLTLAGAPPLGENPRGLPPLRAVRKANPATVAKFAAVAAPLVRTWCGLRGQQVPEVWANGEEPETKFRATLEAAGIMDFREVDDANLLAWCAALKVWPPGMKDTLDRAALEIKTTDIEETDAKAREEAEKREAKKRSVEFDGRDVDPKTADWTKISDVVGEKLSRRIRGTALGTLAGLAPVIKRRKGPGRSLSGGSDNRTRGMPQAKRDMIGRLGELIVYHWLKERFQNQDIDAAWVSKNGSTQLARSQGSDDLGFDFRVEYRRQTWQIEVKASVGDQQRFEMGETEVRAARDAARRRSNTRYVVVYVANPQDPANALIDVLPNPMSPEAEGVLDLLGEGVRFGFRRQ